MCRLIRQYLDDLNRLLLVRQDIKERILLETEDHFSQAMEREVKRGVSEEAAARRVLQRFGSPEQVAEAFLAEYGSEPSIVEFDENEPFDFTRSPDPAYSEIEAQPEGVRLSLGKGAGGMWNRFTERSRRIVFFAQEEAAKLAECHVGTEHLLLALIRESDSLGAQILLRMGISLETLRMALRQVISPGGGLARGQEMMLTPRTKQVIDLAYEEARALNHNYIGSEHLLLGLLRVGEGIASRVLHESGAELEQARKEIVKWHTGLNEVFERRRMHPEEVLLLRTQSSLRGIPIHEIEEIRVRTASGEWVTGRWAGMEYAGSTTPTREGRDLGEILLEKGEVSPADLQQAREMQQQSRGADLGQILIDNGMADERDVANARAASMNMRFVDLDQTRPTLDALVAVPMEIARRHTLLPVMKKGDDLLVAIADPNEQAMEEVRFASGCRVTFAIAAPGQIRSYLEGGTEGYAHRIREEQKSRARERAEKLHEPFLDLDANPPEPEVMDLFPAHLAHRMRAFPVRMENRHLLVASIDPLGGLMKDQLALAANRPLRCFLGVPEQVYEALTKFYGEGKGIEPYIGIGQSDPSCEKEWLATLDRARSLGLRFIDLDSLKPQPDAIATMTAHIAHRFRIVPVLKRGDDLLIAVEDPTIPNLLETLRMVTGCEVRIALAPPRQLGRVLREWYGEGPGESDSGGAPVPSPKPPITPTAPRRQPPPEPGEGESPEPRDAAYRESIAEPLPTHAGAQMALRFPGGEGACQGGQGQDTLFRLARAILLDAFRKGASEIRIALWPERLRVEYRTQDASHEALSLPRYIHPLLASRYLGLVGLLSGDAGVGQRGRVTVQHEDRTYPLEISTLPAPEGEEIVISLLEPPGQGEPLLCPA
ncbi:MAG: hypothetical protein KY468_02135 [Armatimonadetes bacterium]|nr:hypothetical protein [Armatimonadota bacterium]